MIKIWITFSLAACFFTLGVSLACDNTPSPKIDSPDIEATVQARVNAESTVEARVKEELSKSAPEDPTPVPPTLTPVPPIPTPIPPIPTPVPPIPPPNPQQVSIYETVRESIVRIETPKGGMGTGFFVSSDGLIVTNAHVVEGFEKVSVSLYKEDERSGLVLGIFENEDLALISIEAFNVSPIRYDQTIESKIGDPVEAIGFALDLFGEPTLTKGYISAYRERLTGNLSGIQTDAALNPGNSGGPLFNGNGDLIGINTSIMADAEGINFAIDINDARPLIEALIAGHSVPLGRYINDQYPFTIDVKSGWDIYEFNPSANEYFNLHTVLRKNSSSGEISIYTHDLSGELTNLTTDKFAEYMYEFGSDQEFDYYQKLNSEELELSETVNLWAIEEKWKRPNLDYENTGIEYFFVHRGVGYAIYTQSASSEWSSLKPEVEEIVRSFKIDAFSDHEPIVKAAKTPLSDITKTRFNDFIADFQISFEYPSDWLLGESDENNYHVYSSLTGDDFQIGFFPKSYTGNSLESAVTDNGLVPGVSPEWQDYKIQAQTYRNLYGYDGYEFIETYTDEFGYDRRSSALFLDAGNGDVLQISMSSDTTNWTPSGDSILGYAPPESLETIMDSLEIFPKGDSSIGNGSTSGDQFVTNNYEGQLQDITFSFQYPEKWLLSDETNGSEFITTGSNENGDIFLVQVSNDVYQTDTFETAVANGWAPTTLDEWNNFERSEAIITTIQGYSGFQWKLEYQDKNTNPIRSNIHYLDRGNGTLIVIILASDQSRWSDSNSTAFGYKPPAELGTLFDSLEISPKGGNSASAAKDKYEAKLGNLTFSFQYPREWKLPNSTVGSIGTYSSDTSDTIWIRSGFDTYTGSSFETAVFDYGLAPTAVEGWENFQTSEPKETFIQGYSGYQFTSTYILSDLGEVRSNIHYLDLGGGKLASIDVKALAHRWEISNSTAFGYKPPAELETVFDSLEISPKGDNSASATKDKYEAKLGNLTFSFQYPKKWELPNYTADSISTYSFDTSDTIWIRNGFDTYTRSSLETAVLDYGWAPTAGEGWENFQTSEPKETFIQGYSGYQFTMTFIVSDLGESRSNVHYLDLGGGNIASITLNALARRWESSNSTAFGFKPPIELETVFDSLEISPKGVN